MAILAFVVFFFVAHEMWEKVLLIASGIVLIIIGIIIFPLYLEVQSDRIVTRLGVFSQNKAYESSFKKRIFMFDELLDIYVENRKILRLQLQDGTFVSVSLGGFFNKNEIIGLVYEVRAQIKGYEQNKI